MRNSVRKILGDDRYRRLTQYPRVIRMALRPKPPRETAALPQLIRPGDVAFDIGANYGQYARVLSPLVGPDGTVYDMQSYSIQKVPTQVQADLATLGDRLTLPTGWTYRTRTLTETLRITALDGLATIIQDDVANSDQMLNP